MARLVVDGMSVFKTLAGQAAMLDRGYAFSFLSQVTSAVKKLKPTGVDVCWEGGFKKRTELLPDYKSSRVSSSQEVHDQRAELQLLLCHLGVDQYVAPEHEADDMIASLVNTRPGHHVIMSADKDMLQLIRPTVSVFQKVRKAGVKSSRELITHQNFQGKTGWLDPSTFLLAHCALGDAVDQIPKIPRVGEAVIHAYFLGMEIAPSKRQALDDFYAGSEHYLLNRALIDLTQVGDLEHRVVEGIFSEGNAYHLLQEIGFASLVDRFDTWVEPWAKVIADADVPAV